MKFCAPDRGKANIHDQGKRSDRPNSEVLGNSLGALPPAASQHLPWAGTASCLKGMQDHVSWKNVFWHVVGSLWLVVGSLFIKCH